MLSAQVNRQTLRVAHALHKSLNKIEHSVHFVHMTFREAYTSFAVLVSIIYFMKYTYYLD